MKNYNVFCTGNQALGRKTEREISIKTDECIQMRSETEGTVKSSLEPGSRSRDHERLNIEFNDGEFDFRSCDAAAADGGSDGDDWRKMKIESSNVKKGSQQVPVKQDPDNVSNHLSLQATKIKRSSG